MKLSELYKIMKNGGIEEWRNESLILAEHCSGLARSSLLAEGGEFLLPDSINKAVTRRLSGEPIQYILGKWSFCGYEFSVREGCLIPRDDTEVLVREAVECIPQGVKIADVCSGCGCIGIAILLERYDLSCISYDLYEVPLELTRENAENFGVTDRTTVKRADVLGDFSIPDDVEFLVSNPPYIRTDVIESLSDDVKREPHTALDGGEDGLVFYRKLVEICRERKIPALFEIGYDQGDDILALANENGFECKIIKDIGGNDRVAKLTLKK